MADESSDGLDARALAEIDLYTGSDDLSFIELSDGDET
jgi:hypothetical protein